nr:phosphatase PAP2 family protein [uncultured Carboxylicivirga sp.]
MKVVILVIATIVLWGQTIVAQVENVPFEMKLNKLDSVIFEPNLKNYPELNMDLQKQLTPQLDWDYQNQQPYQFKSNSGLKKSLVAPAILLGVGLYSGTSENSNSGIGKRSINSNLQEKFSGFHTSVDDYLQWGPIAMVYGLQASGLRGKHNTWTSTKLLIKSELLTATFVRLLKATTDNVRPDGNGDMSFPSGHTSQAFVAATFLHREYGHISPFYSVAGYTMAASVGTMRMLNQRHWFNDVTVGAAMGIAFTNLVYWHYDRRNKNKKHNVTAVPAITDKGAAIAMLVQF